jgi:hypothetical protein
MHAAAHRSFRHFRGAPKQLPPSPSIRRCHRQTAPVTITLQPSPSPNVHIEGSEPETAHKQDGQVSCHARPALKQANSCRMQDEANCPQIHWRQTADEGASREGGA